MSTAPLGRVLFEGVRSAEPPINAGRRGASASSTLPEAERVATLSPGFQTGSSASHPAGSSPESACLKLAAASG